MKTDAIWNLLVCYEKKPTFSSESTKWAFL